METPGGAHEAEGDQRLGKAHLIKPEQLDREKRLMGRD